MSTTTPSPGPYLPYPEPDATTVDVAPALVARLDHLRDEVRRRLAGLDADALGSAVLPSGWTPLGMLAHLVHMERRWVVWGFAAEQVDRPWGDHLDADPDRPWITDTDLAALLTALDEGGARTRQIATAYAIGERSRLGGRFDGGPDGTEPGPTLLSVLLHVSYEYARHLGHLDAARELIDGDVD